MTQRRPLAPPLRLLFAMGPRFVPLSFPGYAQLIERQFRYGWKKGTYLHDVSGKEKEVDSRIVFNIRGGLGADHGYGRLLHLFRSQPPDWCVRAARARCAAGSVTVNSNSDRSVSRSSVITRRW